MTGVDPDRPQHSIGIPSRRKTATNDAIRNGAQMHEVREFAGYGELSITGIMASSQLC